MRVTTPSLRQKLELLRDVHVKDELIAGLLPHQSKPDTTLGPAALSRCQSNDSFPVDYLGALLRLYGLRPPALLETRRPEHRVWLDLVGEHDVAAFLARVRLLGGDVPKAAPAGSHWQHFLAEQRARADALGQTHILVNRLDRPRASPAFSMRAVPFDSWAADVKRRSPGLVLDAGERIAWMLTVGDLIRPQPSGELHLFAFYDASVDGNRLYIPLLPAPQAEGVVLPETCTTGPFVAIPKDPKGRNCLEVDSGWDERALMVLVTDRPLEEDILEDTRLDGPIVPERLDLLAARLRDTKRQPHGSWALMRLGYRVNQEGQSLAA